MRKKLLYSILWMSVSLFCACGTDNSQQDTAATDTSVEFQNPDVPVGESTVPTEENHDVYSTQEEVTDGQDALLDNREVLEEELASLEVLDWTELTCYADESVSLRNSNLLNYGYVTYDEEGHIYFTDANRGIGGIYVSDYNGENKRQLSEDTGIALQVEGDWLYYKQEGSGIKRIHIETGEAGTVWEGACGEFIVAGGKIYISAPEGFCVIEPDGSNKEILREQNPSMVSYVEGDGFWLGNAINDTDASWFWKGYLMGYDEESDKLFLVDQGSMYPLLAGNWLSVLDVETISRQVWNLETEEMFDLKAYAHRAVSDGNYLYYADKKDSFVTIYRWNGEVTEEIWQVEAVAMEYMYLTPDALYCLPTVVADNKQVQQLWYYDLETGETGIIY